MLTPGLQSLDSFQHIKDEGSTVVEHLTHNPMIDGSNPATGTGREMMASKESLPICIYIKIMSISKHELPGM